jgi:DNA polymerase-4
VDTRAVIPSRRRKSLSVENTYPQDLPDLNACLQRLPELLTQLSGRLRRIDEDYLVVKLFVKIKFADFSSTTIERAGTEVLPEVYSLLCKEAFARKNIPVRLVGVGVRFVDLRDDRDFLQLDLFR